MGVVYEARDRSLDRAVAVKAPLLPQYARALRAEAQAMAALHHPNLVTIHAMGREGDLDFIVMERVVGMTLEDRVAEAWDSKRPVPIDEVLRVLAAITDALTAIHGAGAAHRDVKSANVMLCGRRVLLIDFGLVMPEIAVQSGGLLAGTAGYLAPELIHDTVQPGRGALVDLYALGVVAFELLAGRRPYMGESTHEVLMAHVHRPVPDVAALRSDAPDALAALVRELLAKSPLDRPVSSEEVLWRLDAIRAELPRVDGAAPRLTVLIVDDEPQVGALLERNLKWALPRLTVEVVTDPVEALARMKRHAPDIALVDLNMPGMNGVELCMNLSALPARARPTLVAMSGQASEADVAVLRALGVKAFVPKDAGFVAAVCQVIGSVRRARGHRVS